MPEIAGIEVGLDKSVVKMGAMAAEKAARSVRPGDAAKLIRAIRFGSMRHGFLLEFYRNPSSAGVARNVFNAVLAAADDLGGFRVLVLVAGNGISPPKACVYPEPWRATIGLEGYSEIEPEVANQDAGLSSFERFQKHCGRGNLLLQDQFKALRQTRPHVLRLRYSYESLPKKMSVRRPEYPHAVLTYITTRNTEHEELCDIDSALAHALTRAGLPVVDGRLRIPDEEDFDFASKVTEALKTILGLPANDERPPRAGTETTFWDSLEKLTGNIEAPRDWSAEHDHYLYGVPKRGEDGGE